MATILIRDLADDIVRSIDELAQQQELSRNAFLRQHLTGLAQRKRSRVTVEDLKELSRLCADLENEEIMKQAW